MRWKMFIYFVGMALSIVFYGNLYAYTGFSNDPIRCDCTMCHSDEGPSQCAPPPPPPSNEPPVSDAGDPYSGTVNQPVQFDGSGSSDPDGNIVSYEWDFGDGHTGTGSMPEHTFTKADTFIVSLTVTDNDGAFTKQMTMATIVPANQPPIADAGGPYNGTVNEPVQFDGSGSGDFDGSIISYTWDFGDNSNGTGPKPTHTYTTDGDFTITLVVTDDAGETGTYMTTATIGLGNQAPVATANGPYSGLVNEEVLFDGSGSSDPDGSIVSYAWDFGDGSTGKGIAPIHMYSAKGTYNVILTVTDNTGAIDSATATVTISVGNQLPNANANGPYDGIVNKEMLFDASGSSDPDGTIVSYNWDFGDGSTDTGESPTHTFTKDGTYEITLTVTDDVGETATDMTTATIGPVVNQWPIAEAGGPYSGTVNEPTQFNGSASGDPDGSIISYDWDFGDGNTGKGITPTHSYIVSGTYDVTLTVTDDTGATDSVTTKAAIGIGNQAPIADANNPYSGTVGVPLQFNGSYSTDDGTIVAYDWDFGDGHTGTGVKPTHTYTAPGTYHVTLTVTDDMGVTDSTTRTATIIEQATSPPVDAPGKDNTDEGKDVEDDEDENDTEEDIEKEDDSRKCDDEDDEDRDQKDKRKYKKDADNDREEKEKDRKDKRKYEVDDDNREDEKKEYRSRTYQKFRRYLKAFWQKYFSFRR